MNNNLEICRYIQSNISKLCQTELDEVFKILYRNNSTYTQNNNGVFVNLNWVEESILKQIHDYVLFCLTSQLEINKYEAMKSMMTDSISNKEKIYDCENNNEKIYPSQSVSTLKQSKISSSMKFYLLKKRYQKKCGSFNNNINNTLTHDEYTNV